MELPSNVECSKCGKPAFVRGWETDMKRAASVATPQDGHGVEGPFYIIECPRCGQRAQPATLSQPKS